MGIFESILRPTRVRIRKEFNLVMQDVMQAILGTWARKHTRRLSILCGFEPEKHRRAILAHNLLRKLEEVTEESLEGEGNQEADIMKQWMRWQGIAKERSGKDLVDQMERAEEKYSRRIATKHLGKPHSALHLRQSRHRVLCAQWFMGRFPKKPPLDSRNAWRTRRLLRQHVKESEQTMLDRRGGSKDL